MDRKILRMRNRRFWDNRGKCHDKCQQKCPGSEHDDGEELGDDDDVPECYGTWRVGGRLFHKWGTACHKERSMILRLESTDGWRRVTNVDDRVDWEGWTMMRFEQVMWRRRLQELHRHWKVSLCGGWSLRSFKSGTGWMVFLPSNFLDTNCVLPLLYWLLNNVSVNCVICTSIRVTILTLRKIHKHHCTKSFIGRGSVPGPTEGAYRAPQPIAGSGLRRGRSGGENGEDEKEAVADLEFFSWCAKPVRRAINIAKSGATICTKQRSQV